MNVKINNKDNEPSKKFVLYNIIFKTNFIISQFFLINIVN